MGYIDFEFVKDKLGADDYKRLSQRAKFAAGVDGDAEADAVVTAAIAEADAEIDSLISSKYTTPLDEDYVTAKIKGVSYDITLKVLNSGIQYGDIPEFVMKLYDKAIKYLEKLGDGTARIPGVASGDKTTAVVTGGYDPVMTRKGM